MTRSAPHSFRNVLLWQKAQGLALDVIKLVGPLPRGAVSDVLTRQIVRSATSIAANIAEGHGRFTPRAHAYHLSIAKGSACETDGWSDLLRSSNHITPEQEKPLHETCMEIVAMLTAKMRQLESMTGTRLGEERYAYDAGEWPAEEVELFES